MKELSLHNSSVEDFQNFQGRGKGIKVQRARVVGELSSPDLLIDFEWDQDCTGLGIKQWTEKSIEVRALNVTMPVTACSSITFLT